MSTIDSDVWSADVEALLKKPAEFPHSYEFIAYTRGTRWTIARNMGRMAEAAYLQSRGYGSLARYPAWVKERPANSLYTSWPARLGNHVCALVQKIGKIPRREVWIETRLVAAEGEDIESLQAGKLLAASIKEELYLANGMVPNESETRSICNILTGICAVTELQLDQNT